MAFIVHKFYPSSTKTEVLPTRLDLYAALRVMLIDLELERLRSFSVEYTNAESMESNQPEHPEERCLRRPADDLGEPLHHREERDESGSRPEISRYY